MTKDEALEMAIDLLESLKTGKENFTESNIHVVCSICEEALAQPAKDWIGLSYEEADGLILQYQHAPFKFVRAIEESLKEKNDGNN